VRNPTRADIQYARDGRAGALGSREVVGVVLRELGDCVVVNVVDEAGLDVECAVGREVVRCQAGEGVWEARGEGVGEVAMGHGGEGCHRL